MKFQLPAFMVEKLDKLASLVKVFFMPYWHYDLESHDTSEKEGHLLDMHVDACTESHKLSVKIGSTEETYKFKDIPFSAIPFDFVGSSRFSSLHKAAYDYHLTGKRNTSVWFATIPRISRHVWRQCQKSKHHGKLHHSIQHDWLPNDHQQRLFRKEQILD